MSSTEPSTALIGVFADRRRAEHFVAHLRQAGFREDQIGMASPDAPPPTETMAEKAEEGAVAGALTGTAVGALAGGAMVAGLIPGIGPVVAGGLLGVLGTTATGAAAGGVLGTLVGLGLPEHKARHCEQQLQAGRTLVVVQPAGRFADALTLLHRCDTEDIPGAGSPPAQAVAAGQVPLP
jgi:hypothetical protein